MQHQSNMIHIFDEHHQMNDDLKCLNSLGCKAEITYLDSASYYAIYMYIIVTCIFSPIVVLCSIIKSRLYIWSMIDTCSTSGVESITTIYAIGRYCKRGHSKWILLIFWLSLEYRGILESGRNLVCTRSPKDSSKNCCKICRSICNLLTRGFRFDVHILHNLTGRVCLFVYPGLLNGCLTSERMYCRLDEDHISIPSHIWGSLIKCLLDCLFQKKMTNN